MAGWAIVLTHKSPQEWAYLSSVWCHAFVIGSVHPIDIRNMEKLKVAFLLGVCLGLRDPNDKNLSLQGSLMMRLKLKATTIGLENPANILLNELDGAKIQLALCQRKFDTRFQRLLQEGVEEPADEDEDMSERMSLFEFNDDGRVL